MAESRETTFWGRLAVGCALALVSLLILHLSPKPKPVDVYTGATAKHGGAEIKVATLFDGFWQRRSTRSFLKSKIPRAIEVAQMLSSLNRNSEKGSIDSFLRLGEELSFFDKSRNQLLSRGTLSLEYGNSPACLILVGPKTAEPQVHFEAGQLLQAFSLLLLSKKMGSCIVAGFDGASLHSELRLSSEQEVLYLFKFGYPLGEKANE
jgi:hypothetical protein